HDEDPASDTEATMFESAALGETKKRTLATNDILGIRDAYPGTSVKLGAPALGCEVGTTPACVAVRRGCGRTPAQSLPWLGVLLGILLAGRWYAGRKTVPRRG